MTPSYPSGPASLFATAARTANDASPIPLLQMVCATCGCITIYRLAYHSTAGDVYECDRCGTTRTVQEG